ncbi:Pimeloyl-ACP methyl ester carboxylesterase [Rhodovulum sp. ES.010]|uniref:alpha/beta fold hydrolase n=1 Tax=Rhodovulum sp. ES.010 TaxID=1882821 RepID=UPI000925CFEA|nr:alpha/beta hydrolase [Rhodovulum sp. ES.010]SIO17650.1 Pimeloyl-ACP methyl ester carboxylesterase [Rhodovulum sp. ES.010]
MTEPLCRKQRRLCPSRRRMLLLGAAWSLAGCAPRRNEVLAAYPPEGRFVEVAGRRVHAVVAGQGLDVILLHGASVNARDFTFDLAPRLARRFRFTAFDRPGLGMSDALAPRGDSPADQARLLDAAAARLGVRQAVLVGHSFGAAVALAWAILYPARVAGIVTLAGVTLPWAGSLGPWNPVAASALGGATLVPLVSALAPRAAIDPALAFFFAPQAPPPGYADHVGVELSLLPDALRENARQITRLKPHLAAMAAHYPDLHLPAEILHGTADRIVPPAAQSVALSRRLPNAQLTLLRGVGHMVHHARPRAVDWAIRRAAARAGLHPPA